MQIYLLAGALNISPWLNTTFRHDVVIFPEKDIGVWFTAPIAFLNLCLRFEIAFFSEGAKVDASQLQETSLSNAYTAPLYVYNLLIGYLAPLVFIAIYNPRLWCLRAHSGRHRRSVKHMCLVLLIGLGNWGVPCRWIRILGRSLCVISIIEVHPLCVISAVVLF